MLIAKEFAPNMEQLNPNIDRSWLIILDLLHSARDKDEPAELYVFDPEEPEAFNREKGGGLLKLSDEGDLQVKKEKDWLIVKELPRKQKERLRLDMASAEALQKHYRQKAGEDYTYRSPAREAAPGTIFRKKQESESISPELLVPNSQNPYREALLQSGIPGIEQDPASAEKIEAKYDLAQVLKANQQEYNNMGLTDWAKNIGQADFNHLTPEKRKTIEQEIKDGAIPLFMPDKTTQLNTTVEQFKKSFKPAFIKNSQEMAVSEAYFGWDHFINLINNKAQELVEDVPNRPYISLMKPSQSPEARALSKTVDDQKEEFKQINQERKQNKQTKANITNPHEYGALQTTFSKQVKNKLSSISAKDKPTTLRPIDSATFTRFINLPLSSGGVVPGAGFSPGVGQAEFVGGVAVIPDDSGGFRLSVRVEV